jgi:hypothetical protein
MGEGDSWLDSGDNNIRDGAKEDELALGNNEANIENRSQPDQLLGGQKYQVVYMMYHTVSNTLKEAGFSYAYLKWSSEDIIDEIIKPEYWYTKSTGPPTKINAFDA